MSTGHGFTRQQAAEDRLIQPAAIVAVDAIGRKAWAKTRLDMVLVNTGYAVGEITVTPAKGEQWFIERFDMEWRLVSRIPFNDPNLTGVEPEEGQTLIGSGRGPTELTGTVVNAHGPLVLPPYATADRPEDLAEGAVVWDSDLKQPVYYDGAGWVDAMGNSV